MPSAKDILKRNLANVQQRINAACERARRKPDEVTLVAATKYVGPEVIQALIELGVRDIGENRLQDAQKKFAEVPALAKRQEGVRTHFIGHLQTNKVKAVLQHFDVIHSVDSIKLLREIDKRAAELKRDLRCFVEVNSGEESKDGVPYDQLAGLVDAASQLAHVRLAGLMTMAPAKGDPRPHFRKLAAARGALRQLSMGMSGDFEIAIEEGATHVRVGSALFEGLPTDDPRG